MKQRVMRSEVLAACLVMWTASGALGQAAEPVLSGPKVEEASVPGESRSFGDRLPRGAAEIPPRLFQRALDNLRGREAPSEVRVSGEQERALREAESAFRRDQVAYFAQHREEIRGLAESLGVEVPANAPPNRMIEALRSRLQAESGGRRPGGGAGEPGAMNDPEQQARYTAIMRLRELSEGAPKPRDLHVRLWSVLNEAQREHMLTLLKTYREEAELQRRIDLGLTAGAGRSGRPIDEESRAEPFTDINDPRLPEAVRERLAGLSPRERVRALERMNERLRQAWRRQGGGGRPGLESKPPPSMDQVEVPPPPDGTRK
jgi:hypothetical protein